MRSLPRRIAFFVDLRDLGAGAYFDAHASQAAQGAVGKLGREGIQDARAALEQDDARVSGLMARKSRAST
jgi:hypothetical protein